MIVDLMKEELTIQPQLIQQQRQKAQTAQRAMMHQAGIALMEVAGRQMALLSRTVPILVRALIQVVRILPLIMLLNPVRHRHQLIHLTLRAHLKRQMTRQLRPQLSQR